MPVAELIQRVICEQTYYRWKNQYAGLQSDQVREFKQTGVSRTKAVHSYASPKQTRLCANLRCRRGTGLQLPISTCPRTLVRTRGSIRLPSIRARWNRDAAQIGNRAANDGVEPEMVVEIEFTEWTREGRVRHPSFQGVRIDKPATEVVRES